MTLICGWVNNADLCLVEKRVRDNQTNTVPFVETKGTAHVGFEVIPGMDPGPLTSTLLVNPEWNNLTPEITMDIFSVVTYNGDIYVGGVFQNAGGNSEADNLARWDGCTWHAVFGVGNVYELLVDGNNLYVGGYFEDADDNPDADNICMWNGSVVSAIGQGLNSGVRAIGVTPYGVIAGGWFTDAGGDPDADILAYWDGSNWISMESELTGLNDLPMDIEVIGNDAYVGGLFTNIGGLPSGDGIGRWDGSMWHALDNGLNDLVWDLTSEDTELFVSGRFTSAGGNPDANKVALWDGSSWQNLGTEFPDGIQGVAWSLCLSNGNLYVGYSNDGIIHRCDLGSYLWDSYPTDYPGLAFINTMYWHDEEFYVGANNGSGEQGSLWRWGEPGNEIEITGVPNVVCHYDPLIELPTIQSGYTGNWSGFGVENNIFYPSGLDGNYDLTFTPTEGCLTSETITITVLALTASWTVPDIFCESDDPFDLNSAAYILNGADTIIIPGSWSGPGVSDNIFDPSGLSGYVWILFHPDSVECQITTTGQILITDQFIPEIEGVPAMICIEDDPIVLPLIQDGIQGDWSGEGVLNNTFFPEGLNGLIALTFTPGGNECGQSVTIQIDVLSLVIPQITGIPDTLCQDALSISLPAIQSNIIGNWSGQGVSNNTFDPSDLSGSINLTFTPDENQCAEAASITIMVLEFVFPEITGVPDSLCQSDDPIELPTGQDGFTGVWSGTGVTNNIFDPTGLKGTITIDFTPNQECALGTGASVLVLNITPLYITGVPANICEQDPPIDLPVEQLELFGNWSGPGVVNNTFTPTGLSGLITLTYTPDTVCAGHTIYGITVHDHSAPEITGVPASICENVAGIDLPVVQEGISGNWLGDGVLNNYFNPAGLNGNVFIAFVPDADQCGDTAVAEIVIEETSIPSISGIPGDLCQLDDAIDLPTVHDSIQGSWSGSGVSNNMFDPSGLDGLITLTFQPDPEQCAEPVSHNILITQAAFPNINGIPNSVCASGDTITLPMVQDNITGNWSGEGVTNNIFNPSGLIGIITLYFIPNTDQCADTAQINITIEPIIIPVLAGIPTSICELDNVINLMTEFDNISGNWSGSGISNNAFNTDSLSGFVSITFTPNPDQCAEAASTTIEVLQPIEPEISGIPLSFCQQADAILLPDIQDGISGTWSGPGILNNILNPSGQDGVLIISFTPDDGQCANLTSTQIEVNTPPAFINLAALCDSTSQSYLVSFDIIGGDPSSYLVNGNPLTGTEFVSAPIDALITEYTFLLDDANGCGPVIINGMLNCACATYAGTMNISGNTLNVCEGSDFTVQYFNNALLDPDDLLQFVLHDQASAQLGNVLAISTTPTFSLPPGIVMGQTYYVSAIAGSNNGNGEIDLTDACLSVSQGVPVIFYKPGIQLGEGMDVCYPECISYTIQFQGEAPYAFDYNIFVNNTTYSFTHLSNTNSGSIELCPSDYNLISGTVTLLPLMVTDANCSIPPENTVGLTSIVHTSTTFSFYQELCSGESISINGYVFDQSNPQGSVVIADGNQFGCDSIIEVTLSYREPSYHEITQTLCYGTSLSINGTEYNEQNPSGTEILPAGNQFGCDSIIQIDLMFSSLVTGEYTTTLCTGASVTINGTNYNQSNPSGAEFFPGGSSSGCDSLVNINLSFYPEAASDFSASLCNGEFLVISGIIYDEANPAGIEVLPASSVHGCDSVININLTFYPDVYSYIIDTLRVGEHLIVNGNIYDQFNPSGTEIIPGGSASGCDSIIEVSLHFVQALSVLFQAIAPACYGESTGSINLEGIAGGTPPYSISVDGADPVIISALPTILTGLNAGGHLLHIQDANLNSLGIEIDIPEAPILEVDAGMDQSIRQGENAQLIALANFDVIYWSWSPSDFLSCTDCPDPLAVKPDESLLYTVTATGQNGCIATDKVAVEVISNITYYTPSIFSPNGDQINDTWFISSNDPNTMIRALSVYDRWGGILYSTYAIPVNIPEAGWDGTSGGRSLDPGVYVFVAEVINEDGKAEYLHGDITLIR